MKDFSPEARDQLQRYVTLLQKWNTKINLVSRETLEDIWNRHILDSAQLVELIADKVKTLIDLGSGAGLPGLVLSILRPNISVTLIERDQRKCAFLMEAVRQLDLKNVIIRNVDITQVADHYEVVTARALAPLSELCALAYPLCEANTICFFPKGKNFATEVATTKAKWKFELESFPSKTNDLSVVLSLSNLTHQP